MKSMVVVIAASILLPNGAAAADRGFYFGGSVGWSSVDGIADTDPTVSVGPGLPSEIPINGLPFDDDDTAWSAFVGYQAFQYVGFELAYGDLGRFDSRILLLPSGDPPSLAVDEWSVSARFRYPFGKKFFANFFAGISRASFDVDGEATVLIVVDPLFPGRPASAPPGLSLSPMSDFIPFNPTIPFASPSDETGFVWGFGVTWQFLEKFGLGLDYRQHNVQVQDVETLNVSLLYSL